MPAGSGQASPQTRFRTVVYEKPCRVGRVDTVGRADKIETLQKDSEKREVRCVRGRRVAAPEANWGGAGSSLEPSREIERASI